MKITIEKKTSRLQKQSPCEALAPEIYGAPKPPDDGRIIGLDCHPDTFTAAVFEGTTPHNARHLETRDRLALDALLAWAQKTCTPRDLFLLEAGANSFEVHRRLHALGLRAAVLESCWVGQKAKSYADNDKMAAARLVRVFLAGDAPCVWVPDALSRERRELLHLQQNAVADHTMATNRLKGYFNQYGIRLGARSLLQAKTRAWVEAQHAWSPLQQTMLAEYWDQLDTAATRRRELTRLMAEQVAAEPLMLRVMKLLGIGMTNAFALLAIIGDISRFARPEKLVAYLGLNPGQRHSGAGKRVQLGVGTRGRGDLRHLLIQGAQAVLRSGRQTALGQWGWKLFARKGHRNVAVAAVARKLVVQVWHVLSGHPPLVLEPSKSLQLKLRKLAVNLGQKQRIALALPKDLISCVQHLLKLAATPASAAHQADGGCAPPNPAPLAAEAFGGNTSACQL